MMKKQILVLGLKTFGMSIVKQLSKYNCEVLAIDKDMEKVEVAAEYATQAIQLDIRDAEGLDELSLDEFGAIKLHPTYGVKLIEENLAEVEDKHFIEMAKQMTMYHHEKWDGTGYPSGIAGEKIPLCARIMAVADVLDALLSDRPYKKAYTINEAFQIMEKESGIHFDPYIIETLLTLKNEVYEIAQSDSN